MQAEEANDFTSLKLNCLVFFCGAGQSDRHTLRRSINDQQFCATLSARARTHASLNTQASTLWQINLLKYNLNICVCVDFFYASESTSF